MIGFKAFNENLICRDMKYEIGETYTFDGEPILCKQGFHFCRAISQCYNYYPLSDKTRICVVEALGDIVSEKDNSKYCTNKIKIIGEITEAWVKKGNIQNSSGYFNTGTMNSGNYNIGGFNTGSYNSGSNNQGNFNSGDCNNGHANTGKFNTGSFNTGQFNIGNDNTGDFNIGNWNTGNSNIGKCNTGDFNLGDYNTGVFNKKIPYMTFFDKPSNWTYMDWFNSDARIILNRLFKEGKYGLNNIENWWNTLNKREKRIIRSIPNFDEAQFFEILTAILDGKRN